MSSRVSEHTKVNIVKFHLYLVLGKVDLEVRLLCIGWARSSCSCVCKALNSQFAQKRKGMKLTAEPAAPQQSSLAGDGPGCSLG